MSSNPDELPRHNPDEKSQLRLLPRRQVSDNQLTQNQLTQNIDWTRDLVEHSRDLLCVHDLEGRLLSVNPVPARLLGYTVDEILKVPMRELLDPKFRDQFDDYFRQLASAGEATGILAVLTRTGRRRLWEYHCTLRTEGVEKPVVRGIAHDVTDRIAAEKALRESNKKLAETADGQETLLRELQLFRTLLDHSNDAIEVVDPTTLRFLDVNEKSCAELGYTREEFLSMTIFDIDPQLTPDVVARVRELLLKTGFVIKESVHRRKDGTIFPIEVNLKRVQLDREYVVAISRDITERKRTAARLEESEKRFRAVHDRAPVGIAVVDSRSGRFLLVNPKYCEIVGRTEQEMLSLSFGDITHPADQDGSVGMAAQLCDEKIRDYDLEKRYVRPDGTVVWVNLSVAPMWKPGEQARQHMAIVQDITERKQAEGALRTSERDQHKIAEQLETERARLIEAQAVAKVGSWETELPSLDITWSEQTHRIFETDPSSFHPSRPGFVELVHPEDRAKVDAAFEASLEKGAPSTVEYRIVMADGRVKVLEERWKVFHDGQAEPARLMGTCQDITERKRSEQALRESEERLRLSQEVAKIGTLDQNLLTGESNSTPPLQAMYGLRPHELPRSENFINLIHPEDRPHVSDLVARSLESGEGSGEWRTRWRDGTVRWISSKWRVFKDANGKPIRVIRSDYDITDRKLIEQKLRAAQEKLTEEKLYLEHEIEADFGVDNIVGQSKALKEVMESVARVAASDATVLLLGETGTGKELVARAIHRLSRRAGNAFIKMNCAAIPSGLLESELFGHEKGAFTGAVTKKIGRLELADQGTILLDEIGEISLALQPKLLRVLQDQEFERLGGTQTLKIDFRLIAATNSDLAKSVQEKEFRSDLYYRLNVFPIFLPPLRERREDIPLLVEHFVQKIARRMNKSITTIPKKTMDALIGWSWPGNVRELENFLERSLILTTGSVLAAPLSELQLAAAVQAKEETLEAAERRHILTVLRETRGQISGPRGAATRLGVKRTTLQSKLKQLGINPRAPS